MVVAVDRPCANPACHCTSPDVTCSLWCGAPDRPAGVPCICRHEVCTRPLATALRAAMGAAPGGRRPAPDAGGVGLSRRLGVPGVRAG